MFVIPRMVRRWPKVRLRPVILSKIDELAFSGMSAQATRQRKAYAEWLAFGDR